MEEFNRKDKEVVVLSRNFATGLSVVRSLGYAGYKVDLIANAHKEGVSEIIISSKYVNKYKEIISAKVRNGSDDDIIEEIVDFVKDQDEKRVLFPVDDYTASLMDTNRDALEEYFIMPKIVGQGQGAIMNAMDKTVQAQIAKEVGLLTPMDWIIDLRGQIIIPDDVKYPVFVKPIESATGYKTEMAKCDNEEELENHLIKLQRRYKNRSILVQEFLQIDNEIDLGGVCLDQEVIIPAIIKKTRVAQYERGVTLAGKLYPTDELGEVKEKVYEMLRRFHYVGMFDMELNLVGDKIYFNEVNFRSGGPNFSYFRSGINLPALYVDEAYGRRHLPEEEKVEAYGKNFIYEKVAWDDYINGFMSKKELNDTINDADITLLNWDEDPEPGRIFTSKTKKKANRRKLGNIKRWVMYHIRLNFGAQIRHAKDVLSGYPQTKSGNKRSEVKGNKPRVLVAGRNYCSNLTMAKQLGEAGYEVEVLRIFQVKPKFRLVMRKIKPDAYSKYVKGFHLCISNRRSKRIFRRFLELADTTNKMLLIPADDLVANVVDQYYDELKEFYYLPNVNNEAGEIGRLMSKDVQKQMAIDAGLPVLGSCVIRTIGGEFEIPDSVKYPCFIKPNISKNSSKSRMRKCDSKQELSDTLKEFSKKKDIEMLVEDYADIDREYSILGVSTKNGAIGPGFFRAEIGGQDEHRGVALIGKMLPSSKYDAVKQQCIDFVGSLGYEGLYDVDLITTKDGTMYFVELNLRFGASGYAVSKCGVNLPGMFADYMIYNKPIDMDAKIEDKERTFISERVVIDEYVMGRITRKEMFDYIDQADIHFIKDEDDKKPYKHFKKFYNYGAVMRKLHEIKYRNEEEA